MYFPANENCVSVLLIMTLANEDVLARLNSIDGLEVVNLFRPTTKRSLTIEMHAKLQTRTALLSVLATSGVKLTSASLAIPKRAANKKLVDDIFYISLAGLEEALRGETELEAIYNSRRISSESHEQGVWMFQKIVRALRST